MRSKIIAVSIALAFVFSGVFVASNNARGSSAPVLTVGIVNSGPITNLNPFYPGGESAVAASQLTGLTYLSMLYQAPNGTLMPQLVQTWNVNANGTVFTFNLRPNLKWSDGTPLTANDVVFTFHIFINSPLLDSFNGFIVGNLIKNVTALSTTQVRFTLVHPFSPFLQYATLGKVIVPEHIWSKVSNITNFSNTGTVVGDGPFIPQNFSPGQTVIHYKPNPYYYGSPPKISGIAVQILSSTSNVESLLQTGAIDLAQPAANQLSALESLPKMHVSVAPGISIFGTYFDPAGLLMYDNLLYPYNITKVRQALAYAINRTQVVQLGLNGYGTPGSQGQMPPSLKQWIPPNLPNYTYNPALARSMLLSLGFKNGSNGYLEFPNGTAWAPTIMDTGGSNSQIVAVLVQDLKAAGIDASESVVTIGVLVSALEYGNFNMLLLTTSRPPIPDFVLGVFASNSTTPVGQQELNYHGWTRWSNSTVISDLAMAREVGNFSGQYALYSQVQQIYATQLPLITLFYGDAIWAYSNATIQGWGPAVQGYQFPQAPLLTSLSGPAAPAPSSNNTTLYLGIGIAVVIIVAAAAVVLSRRRQR